VFDKTKLSWMNGQHLRALPEAEMQAMVGERWVASGLLARAESPFAAAALAIVQSSLELVAGAFVFLCACMPVCLVAAPASCCVVDSSIHGMAAAGPAHARVRAHAHAPRPSSPPAADADRELRALLSYPLSETVASEASKVVLEDGFQQIAETVLAAYDSGDLATALQSGHDGFKVSGCGVVGRWRGPGAALRCLQNAVLDMLPT
jgi:glutamyl-tRNA synthetase